MNTITSNETFHICSVSFGVVSKNEAHLPSRLGEVVAYSGSSSPSSSPSRGHCVVLLGKTLYSHNVLSIQVYKWVPVNLMLWVNYVMD